MRTTDMAKRNGHDEPILVDILKTKSADEWEAIFNAAGLAAARVRTLNEALASTQVASRTVVGKFPSRHSKHGELKPSVAAFCCSEDGPAVNTSPPELGEHTRSILEELGYTPEAINDLYAADAI